MFAGPAGARGGVGTLARKRALSLAAPRALVPPRPISTNNKEKCGHRGVLQGGITKPLAAYLSRKVFSPGCAAASVFAMTGPTTSGTPEDGSAAAAKIMP